MYGLGEGDERMRRFYVVSTVMGNDEKCLLLRVGFRFSAVDLPAQKFCAGPKRKVANAIDVFGRARGQKLDESERVFSPQNRHN